MSKKLRGGIKTEAVGRYSLAAKEIIELSSDIEDEANHFYILFEYDYDADKMLALANSIKEKAEKLYLNTKYIADSIPKEVDE